LQDHAPTDDDAFTDVWTTYLTTDKVRHIIETNAVHWLSAPFHLPLTQFLGKQGLLYLPVREVEPLGSILVQRPAFPVANDQEKHMVQLIHLENPPVVPYFESGRAQDAGAQASEILELWLREFAETEYSGW
jgi:hypothetical protein